MSTIIMLGNWIGNFHCFKKSRSRYGVRIWAGAVARVHKAKFGNAKVGQGRGNW